MITLQFSIMSTTRAAITAKGGRYKEIFKRSSVDLFMWAKVSRRTQKKENGNQGTRNDLLAIIDITDEQQYFLTNKYKISCTKY